MLALDLFDALAKSAEAKPGSTLLLSGMAVASVWPNELGSFER